MIGNPGLTCFPSCQEIQGVVQMVGVGRRGCNLAALKSELTK